MSRRPDTAAGFASMTHIMPNRMSALRPMSAWIVDAARAQGAGERSIHALELVANEAVANTIEHAFPDGGTHDIALALSRVDDGLELTIVDDGVAFDPVGHPEPVEHESLGDMPVGGLGIALIRRVTDVCRYVRDGQRNVLTVRVRLDRTGAGSAD